MRSARFISIGFLSLAAGALFAGEREAFLAAIGREPSDDTARLVFADWLDEQGDPRGTFIRTQMDVEKTPLGRERAALEHQEAVLLQKHSKSWLPELPSEVLGVAFRRGFVDYLKVSTDILARPNALAELVRACPGVSKIEFVLRERPTRAQWDGFLHSAAASPIKNIYFSTEYDHGTLSSAHADRIDDALRSIAKSPHLRPEMVDIGRRVHPSDEAFREFVEGRNLNRLHTLHANLTADGATRLAASLSIRLAALYAYQIPDNASLTTLVHSPTFAGLRALTIGIAPFGGDQAIQTIEASAEMRGLEHLSLHQGSYEIGHVFISDAGIRTLAHSRNLQNLKSLKLWNVHPNILAFVDIRDSKVFQGLASLDLSCMNGQNHFGMQIFAETPFKTLRHLELFAQLDDRGATALAASPHLRQLVSLNLRNNPIGRDGLRALVQSPNLAGLQRLDLSTSSLPQDARTLLSNKNQLSELTALTIDDTELSEPTVLRLVRSPQMPKLVSVTTSNPDWYETNGPIKFVRGTEVFNQCHQVLEALAADRVGLGEGQPYRPPTRYEVKRP